MTENEMIASVSEMETVPIEEDNKAKYYATNLYLRTCPVCGKVFSCNARVGVPEAG